VTTSGSSLLNVTAFLFPVRLPNTGDVTSEGVVASSGEPFLLTSMDCLFKALVFGLLDCVESALGGVRLIGDNGAIFGGCFDRAEAVGVPVSKSLDSGTPKDNGNEEEGSGEGGRGICIPDCRSEVARADIGGLTRGVIVEGEKEEE
jgi:hypothetical protein